MDIGKGFNPIGVQVCIDEFIDKKETLWLLSKHSIQSKEADSIAETIRQTRNLINELITKI